MIKSFTTYCLFIFSLLISTFSHALINQTNPVDFDAIFTASYVDVTTHDHSNAIQANVAHTIFTKQIGNENGPLEFSFFEDELEDDHTFSLKSKSECNTDFSFFCTLTGGSYYSTIKNLVPFYAVVSTHTKKHILIEVFRL